MRVEDLMSREVVAVTPQTSLKEVGRLLSTRGISGTPVVSEARQVLGVVSEADIIVKERGEERHRPLLGRLRGGFSVGRAKLRARTAGEAMTSPAITIGEHDHVSEAARRMTEAGVKRLPVVDWSGALVGIVTRADLVKAFARPDEAIEQEIRSDLVAGVFWMNEKALNVRVERGEVELGGQMEQRFDAELLPRLVARVPGVVGVRSTLTWQFDEHESSPKSLLELGRG